MSIIECRNYFGGSSFRSFFGHTHQIMPMNNAIGSATFNNNIQVIE